MTRMLRNHHDLNERLLGRRRAARVLLVAALWTIVGSGLTRATERQQPRRLPIVEAPGGVDAPLPVWNVPEVPAASASSETADDLLTPLAPEISKPDIATTDTPGNPDWANISLPLNSDIVATHDSLLGARFHGDPARLPDVGGLPGKTLADESLAVERLAAQESPIDFLAAGMGSITRKFDVAYGDFSPTPLPEFSEYHDADAARWVYDSKKAVPTQAPWIEWGRLFYADGITPRGIDWFGPYNMVRPQFYLYGDLRTGIQAGRNGAGRADNMASRLNLDMDLRITDTERFHGFIGPLDRGNQFNAVHVIDGQIDVQGIFDPNFVTAFFEGDLGAMWGGFHNKSSPMELPVTIGLVPLLFQNGIWMEDAVTGAAFALPARHSRLLNWNNYDVTFFAAIDQINSPAFGLDEHAAQFFGNAWFIEAYDGYIEAGYAFVRDRNNPDKSYHNMTASFTRRYLDRISNSVRIILNQGQDLAEADRTADGGLFLLENSWITSAPLTFVPYANFFYGWGRPQSVARNGNAGGILRNTGINFDTDALNGLATLDPTGFDTAGGSVGVDLIGSQLDRQLLLEASYVTEHGDSNPFVNGDQFGLGARYQFPITHSKLLRFDVMHGWRGDLPNVYGTRMEYRWKF